MDLNSPTGQARWIGGVAGVLHDLLNTEDGQAFLTSRPYSDGTYFDYIEEHYRTYREWLSKGLADAEAFFGRGAA